MDPAQNPVKSAADQTVPDNSVNDGVVPTALPANPPIITPPNPVETIPLPPPIAAEPVINPLPEDPVNPTPVNPEPIQQPTPEPVNPVLMPADPEVTSHEEPPSFNTSPQSPVYIPAQNPPPPTSYIKPKRFPFMFITIILVLVLLGFGGTVLYFKMVPSKQNKVVVQITPPVSIFITPSQTPSSNPFATPSASVVNPFISVTPTYSNPFGATKNPFSSASDSANATNSAYKNPFEEAK
mgnify:CR=1 FL=1